jgi:hypothetical protein
VTAADRASGGVSRLPPGIDRYGVSLRRWRAQDTAGLHELIVANIDHLRPYMHWIEFEPQTMRQRRALVDRWSTDWAAGGDLLSESGAVIMWSGLPGCTGGLGPEVWRSDIGLTGNTSDGVWPPLPRGR